MGICNLLTHPPHLPLIAPSILSADFARLGADSAATLDAGADLLHVDVMDGHFAPNLTMGPAMVGCVRAALPEAFLDVHLMVTDPADFVTPFADAGSDHLTFHIEAVPEPRPLIDRIRDAGMSAGLAISPDTPVETLLPFVADIDLVLVMSVRPGFSGQAFIPEVLETTRAISERLGPHQRLQMDGGVNGRTVEACRDAGCDVIVAASAIFRTPDYAASISTLRVGPVVVAGDG